MTFPCFLRILLWFAMVWSAGCSFSTDEKVYTCSTSSECVDGWVCQCTENSSNGGQCVAFTSATGVVGDCSNISPSDVKETDSGSDTDALGDGSEVVDIGPDTADSLDDASNISWRDVATVADTVDFSDVLIGEDVGSVDLDSSIKPYCPETVENVREGMVYVPCGTFWMGCNEATDQDCWSAEHPQHEVTLSAYFIDKTEVTVSAYKACVSAGVCSAPNDVLSEFLTCNYESEDKDNHPVNCVTWCQARAYCQWRQKRLPTEAEWEMGARGSCQHNPGNPCKNAMRTYPWGNETATCEFAVMFGKGGYGCGAGGSKAVGSMVVGDSPYRINDMSGNVWEWVEDCWGTYAGESVVNPLGASCASPNENCEGGGLRVVRGGGFAHYVAWYLRASYRHGDDPSYTSIDQGFRCALSIP